MNESTLLEIQELLRKKADLSDRMRLIPFDGSLEIKEVSGSKYIYARKREVGRKRSTYLAPFSPETFANFQRLAIELRLLKKEMRRVEKSLAELGHVSENLSPRILLNIDFGRANMKALIYDQAVLEGVGTTFPQTEAILENGKVNGVKAEDVLKIINLKHAWEFILDKDVVQSPTNFHLLSYIARLVNEGIYNEGGRIRGIPVAIGGSTYVPPLPLESVVSENINTIIHSSEEEIMKGIELALYVMKTQVFNDGNKRSAIIFANHYLISKGLGLLVVPEASVSKFKKLLISYYEDKDSQSIRTFLKNTCWRKF